MAVVSTILNNGTKNLLLHVYLNSDGSEGELKNFVLADSELYDGIFSSRGIVRPDMKLKIMQVWYNFSWFDGFLSFDDTSPVPGWQLPRDAHNYLDFRYFGGLSHRLVDPQTSKSTDRTGKLLFSTNGYAVVGSTGTMVLEIKKDATV